MNVRRLLYLAVLLLLPALVFAQNGDFTSEDPTVKTGDLFSFFLSLALFVLIIPIGLCVTHSNRPAWFARWRILVWLAGFMVSSWVCVNAMVFVPHLLGLSSIRGPEVAFTLVLGWLYLPIAALPVLTIYVIIQVVRGKIHKRVVLWPLAVVAFLYCCILIRRQYNSRKTPPPPTPHANQVQQPNQVTDVLKSEGRLQ